MSLGDSLGSESPSIFKKYVGFFLPLHLKQTCGVDSGEFYWEYKCVCFSAMRPTLSFSAALQESLVVREGLIFAYC